MKKTKDKKVTISPEIIIPKGFKLKSQKSKTIRATFTLSLEAINALEELKKRGFKFRILIEKLCTGVSLMPLIVKTVKGLAPKSLDLGVRKTIVISGEAQKELNKASEEYKISRDVLVDSGIKMTKLLVEKMERKSKSDHKRASEIIGRFYSEAEKTEKTLQEFLDSDDPILDRFSQICAIISNLDMAIEQEIEKGTPISPDNLGQNN
jgi:hypothetical protein